MTRRIILGTACLILTSLAQAETATDLLLAQRLWDQALAAVERGLVFKPTLIESLNEETDSKGKVLLSESAVHSLSYPAGSNIAESQLISSQKNGQDNTAERRQLEAQARAKSSQQNLDGAFTSFASTPLDRAAQENIKLVSIRTDSDEALIAYELESKTFSYTGTVRLKLDQAYPVEVVQTYKKRPLFVQTMEFRLLYNPPLDHDGPAVTVASVEYQASATVLFFKKHLRGQLVFCGYAPAP